MNTNKIINIAARRRPSIEIEGYTLQSPPSGTGYMAKSFYWGVNGAKAVPVGGLCKV